MFDLSVDRANSRTAVMADLSEVKEVFLDFLHMGQVFLAYGYKLPPEFVLNRASYASYCRRHEEYMIRRAKYELKRQKLLQIREEGGQVVMELTEKGKVEAFKQEIMSVRKRLSKSERCLVVFDIPENISKLRDVFRSFLIKAGFEQVQLSVWQSQFDVVGLLSGLVKQLDIEKWVQVYRAKPANSQ
jgi:hypothetical protein